MNTFHVIGKLNENKNRKESHQIVSLKWQAENEENFLHGDA